jgi:hypothetical protein
MRNNNPEVALSKRSGLALNSRSVSGWTILLLELQSKLVASVQAGYNSPSRLRDSDLAFDGTPQQGEAATGFVQWPAIPPRRKPCGLAQPAGSRGGIAGHR